MVSHRVLVEGTARGELLVLEAPLSLWGGLDPASGVIVDRNHPQQGRLVTGRILCLPHGRGSSSSSTVLAETLRIGTGPAGLVLGEPDGILVAGVAAARFLYSVECPVLCGPAPDRQADVWVIGGGRLAPADSG